MRNYWLPAFSSVPYNIFKGILLQSAEKSGLYSKRLNLIRFDHDHLADYKDFRADAIIQ